MDSLAWAIAMSLPVCVVVWNAILHRETKREQSTRLAKSLIKWLLTTWMKKPCLFHCNCSSIWNSELRKDEYFPHEMISFVFFVVSVASIVLHLPCPVNQPKSGWNERKKQFQFHTIHIIQVHFDAKQIDYNVSIDNLNGALNCGIDIPHAISRISASLSVDWSAASLTMYRQSSPNKFRYFIFNSSSSCFKSFSEPREPSRHKNRKHCNEYFAAQKWNVKHRHCHRLTLVRFCLFKIVPHPSLIDT